MLVSDHFFCSRCGCCCSQLPLFGGLYDDLDRGDGICLHYDLTHRACKIYENRPEKCRVDDQFACFSGAISYEKYLMLCEEGCALLRKNQRLSNRYGNPMEVKVFIQNLTSEQQAVFLHLARAVASADGDISKEEQQMVDIFSAQMPGVEAKECALEDLVNVFDSKRARVSAFLELAAIAQAETGINHNEKQFLDSLATAFNLNDYEVNDMLSWVIRQFNLINEAQTFMEE